MELAIIQDPLTFLNVQVGDAQSHHIGEVHLCSPWCNTWGLVNPWERPIKTLLCCDGLAASDLDLLESAAYLWVMDAKWSYANGTPKSDLGLAQKW